MCGLDRRSVVHEFTAPPEGEVRFDLPGEYRRELLRCDVCGHVVSAHGMDMSGLYEGAYVDATYGSGGMQRTFERVSALPPAQSDNAGRVARIGEFLRARGTAPGRLLDVGSGTGIFPHRMAAEGFTVTALDPDSRAVEHLREVAGVDAVLGDFTTMARAALGRFDLVTFNKVLEHVLEPILMLAGAREVLADDGLVYVELPDAEVRNPAGWGREEFFVDHHHIFTAASLSLLLAHAGFRVASLERLVEPSGKFTLRAFALAQEE
jgi:SAM-dependent methyltransferase